MALTPMDIAQKEFSHAMRGYSVEEVDAFLDEVKNEFANLLNTLEESRRVAASYEQKIAHYVEIESTLNSAFVSAQKSADAIIAQAKQEGESLLEQARSEGERIYRDADQQRRDMERQAENEKRAHQLELARLKDSEDRFRKEYAALIAHFTAELQDIPVTEVEVAPVVEGPDEASVETVVEEVPVEEVSPAPAPEPTPVAAAPVEEIAEEAVVEEVTVEEVAPAPAAPEPTPVAPAPMPAEAASTDVYGEMEDDLDIEEID